MKRTRLPRIIKRTKIILFLLAMMIVLLAASCSPQQEQRPEPAAQELTIVTTFFPLSSLVREIVGEQVKVYSLIPAGVEPHDYEATAGDIQRVNSADVFITLGGTTLGSVSFAPAENKITAMGIKDLAIIPAGRNIPLLGADPHIWLSPVNAKTMVQNMMGGLVLADPLRAEEYQTKAKSVLARLDALDAEFRQALSSCQKDIVIVNHDSFSYLAKEYNFQTLSISGLEPEAEPSPAQIKSLIDKAKINNIKYILYEKLVDPRIAQTIAAEVGATTLKLDPLEGTDEPSATYFSLMKDNLNILKVALEC